MPVPEMTEGPVNRDANNLCLRKDRWACSLGSMRCLCPKSPKGLLAGTQTPCVVANTAGLAVGEACDALARKKSYGRFAGTQTTFVLANTAGPAVGDACDALARKERSADLQGRNRLASTQALPGLLSGKHAMPVPEKTGGPVSRDANDLHLR